MPLSSRSCTTTGQSHLIFGTGSTGCLITNPFPNLCRADTLYEPLENLDAIALRMCETNDAEMVEDASSFDLMPGILLHYCSAMLARCATCGPRCYKRSKGTVGHTHPLHSYTPQTLSNSLRNVGEKRGHTCFFWYFSAQQQASKRGRRSNTTYPISAFSNCGFHIFFLERRSPLLPGQIWQTNHL